MASRRTSNPYNHTGEVFLRVLSHISSLLGYSVPVESLPLGKLLRETMSICVSSYPMDMEPGTVFNILMDGMPGVFLSAVIIALDEEFFRSIVEEEARGSRRGEEDKHL